MELQERIEKLEKERWIYLGLGALALLAAILGALLGAGITSNAAAGLEGQTLVLRGAEGESLVVQDGARNPRFSVGLDEKGMPHLHFYDGQKKRRVSLGLLTAPDPELQLLDRSSNVVAHLVVNEAGQPRLTFSDSTKTKRENLSLDAGGDPKIEFFDRRGLPAYTVPPTLGASTPAAK
jgi:hypothetical protein